MARKRSGSWLKNHDTHARSLRFESLEDRRLLAAVTVGNNSDLVNGNTGSISALIGNNGGDGISLREAILAANATSGADFDRLRPGTQRAVNHLGGHGACNYPGTDNRC